MKLIQSQPFSQAGFTLLELLIALVVFSVVLLAVNSIFYGALKLRNKTNDAVVKAVELEHALKTIKRDLANLVAPGGTMSGELQTATVGGIAGETSPVIYTSTGLLEPFTPFGQVQKVSYTVAMAGVGIHGKDLYRNVTRNLLPQTQEDISSELLLTGVESLAFQFFDGSQWRTSWDSATEDPKLPKAIKAQLIMADEETTKSLMEPIELVVPVMVTASTNATANATGEQP